MKSSAWNMAFAGLLASGMCAVSTFAEDGMKALPTLLIKGEVVSVDVSDPAASLLKVKDRYGFETPIFLTQETKVTQADAAFSPSSLQAGTAVEVEYNFDVNTAKRHAVSVKVAGGAQAAAPAPAAPAVVESAPVVETPVQLEAPSTPDAEVPVPQGQDAPVTE